MSFPYDGAYFTFRLDPAASLQDLEDDEVALAARQIEPKVYVACTTQAIGAPQLPPLYDVAYMALVQQGLPPDKPEEFLESRMCVPIRPNTQHPDGRRPAHCCHPLPWDDCYHVALHHTRVRIKSEFRPVDPPHSLGPGESVALNAVLEDDERRRECLRDCAARGVAPPPASLGEMALSAIRLANSEVSDTPYWQVRAAELLAEDLADPSDEDDDCYMVLDKNWKPSNPYSRASSYSGDGSHAASGPASTHSEGDVQDDNATPATDDVADVANDILAAINYQSDLRDVSPVIVPLSYDLSTLDAPPSPAGFMEELDAIRRIRSEYEERVRRLKVEVRRRDDEYMAGIEARRTESASAQALSVPIAPSMPTRESKWSITAGFVPIANKLKSRLGALPAPKVLLIGKRAAIKGQAKETQGVDDFVCLETQEALRPICVVRAVEGSEAAVSRRQTKVGSQLIVS
ncbi:hypothetical protein GGF50DRAFT_123356 [Schizophyllum commune]